MGWGMIQGRACTSVTPLAEGVWDTWGWRLGRARLQLLFIMVMLLVVWFAVHMWSIYQYTRCISFTINSASLHNGDTGFYKGGGGIQKVLYYHLFIYSCFCTCTLQYLPTSWSCWPCARSPWPIIMSCWPNRWHWTHFTANQWPSTMIMMTRSCCIFTTCQLFTQSHSSFTQSCEHGEWPYTISCWPIATNKPEEVDSNTFTIENILLLVPRVDMGSVNPIGPSARWKRPSTSVPSALPWTVTGVPPAPRLPQPVSWAPRAGNTIDPHYAIKAASWAVETS